MEKNFFSKLTGFKIAVMFSLIVVILFGAIYFGLIENKEINNQKAFIAKASFEYNQMTLSEGVKLIEEELMNPSGLPLEDDYLHSTKDDFEWLIEKEKTLYSTGSADDVVAKEFAFTSFLNEIVQLNDSTGFDFGEPNYENTINEALALKIEFKNKIPEQFKKDLEESGLNATLFNNTLNELLSQYYSQKIALLNNSSSIERRFVEAKKIIYLQYIDLNYSFEPEEDYLYEPLE